MVSFIYIINRTIRVYLCHLISHAETIRIPCAHLDFPPLSHSRAPVTNVFIFINSYRPVQVVLGALDIFEDAVHSPPPHSLFHGLHANTHAMAAAAAEMPRPSHGQGKGKRDRERSKSHDEPFHPSGA